jgi:hypothetical protein
MRVSKVCAMLVVAASTSAVAATLAATAQTGVKTRVSEHVGFDGACAPQHVVLKVTSPPANGEVTVAEETRVLPEKTKLGGVQKCAGKSAPTAVVYYTSKANFKGTDQFKYQRINEDNPKDRLNGEIVLTVTVK